MNAETMIKEYWSYKNQAELLKSQIIGFKGVSEIEIIESINFYKPQEERTQTNRISDKTAKAALNYKDEMTKENEDWLLYLKNEYKSVCNEICFFETALDLLSGYLPELMRDMIINRVSWQEISYKYNISHAMVGKNRKKAIKELDMLYSKREEQSTNFMLS